MNRIVGFQYFILLAAIIYFLTGFQLPKAHANSHFKNVIYVVFENEDFEPVISNAYFKKLSERGVLLKNFRAETHPSQGNYIAMVAGNDYRIVTDANIDLASSHLGDLLDAKKMTWTTYAEGYPGNCFLGSKNGRYVRKHTPFLSFTNVTKNLERCNSAVLNFSQFKIDASKGELRNFNFIVPDLVSDGHDSSIQTSADWIQKNIEPLFSNPQIMAETLFVITYDEGSYKGNNGIYTVLLGAGIKEKQVSDQPANHYSLLRLFEEEWGLGSLNQKDTTATKLNLF